MTVFKKSDNCWMTLVVITLLLFASSGRSEEITPNDPFTDARGLIRQLMKDENISSFQVAVAKDGNIIFEEAFGWANVGKQIRTTTETMHLVASIEKPFTSTALMILAERGLIDLHGPINEYLGDIKLIAYQGNAADATVARMMLHTSGFPYGYYICGDDRPLAEHRTAKDILDLAGVLVSTPGTRYEYSNLGYRLFADVVYATTGVPIKEFIQKEIIVPLGLEHTRFFREHPPVDMIATQNFQGEVLPVAFDADGYTALYSTAGDLARFGMFTLKAHLPSQQSVLSDSNIDMLWQYREPGLEITTRRLAWDVQKDYGLLTVQHGGGGPGIHNWLYMVPAENIVIAIMSNARYRNSPTSRIIVELISATISESGKSRFSPGSGRGYGRWPRLDPAEFSGKWAGYIKGPKGMCPVELEFDSCGTPKLRINGKSAGAEKWIPTSSRRASTMYGKLLWRFDTRIPYLYPYAIHDEVIISIWPEGTRLIGSASAAKEKDFGKGENYVLPQYVELRRK